MRLDKYLTTKYPNLSRVYIKNQIKLGNFLVGDKHVKPSYILRQGDQVALAPGFSLPDATQLFPNPNIKLDIIYEDDDVIVINKPAGLSVHPRQDKNGLPLLSEIDSTLVSGLLAYYPVVASVGDTINPPQPSLKGGSNPPPLACLPARQGGAGGDFIPASIRPGIVHRLDKDTSGVMIIAKNQIAFDWLKKQFKERQTNKTYLAIVRGKLENKEGEIKTLLARATGDPTKQKVVSHGSLLPSNEGRAGWGDEIKIITSPQSPPHLRRGGKLREAITQYKVIKEFKDYSLVEARPKTGRLHQIRVHLAYLGHPVVGDKKYGRLLKSDFNGLLTRQFLHAKELEITLPNGPRKTFNAPLPADLNSVLQALENM